MTLGNPSPKSVEHPSPGGVRLDGGGNGKVLAAIARSLRRSPLCYVAVFLMIGIALADLGSWGVAAILLALLAGLVFVGRRTPIPCGTVIAGAAFGLVAGAILHHRELATIHSFPLAKVMEEGRPVEIEADGWFSSRPQPGERWIFGTIDLTSLTIGGAKIPCAHRVPARIQGDREIPEYGDRLRLTGVLHPLERAPAPGAFDPALFHYRQSGSLARLEVRLDDLLERREGTEGHRLIAFAHRWRASLEKQLVAGLSPGEEPYGRLIAAMSLGARENSPGELEEAFKLSGTMHMFAVSGLHVGVVAGVLVGTLLCLRLPKRAAVLIAIPLILFYAVLTGLRPSAVRAAVMLAVILAGFAVKENPRLLNSLGLAGILILLIDTRQLFLPGFQLSFMVLLFIALFTDPVRKRLAAPWLTDPFIPNLLRSPLQRTKDRLVGGVAAGASVSLVSWLGSLGLLSWHFQSFAPIGIVANLVMVPFAGILVTLAMASLACFGAHLTVPGILLNKLNVSLAIFLTSMAQFFGGLPGAHYYTGATGLRSLPAGTLELDLIGEGGDQAALLSFPPDRGNRTGFWMIDTGSERAFNRQMLPLVRTRGVNGLDGLVLTHGDIGHIGAAQRVMTQFRPPLLLETSAPNRSPVYPGIDSLARDRKMERLALDSRQRIRLREETFLSVLWPPPDFQGRTADDHCLVLKLVHEGWAILLTSDAGFETEKALLDLGTDLRADVWVKGWHHEAPGGLAEFLTAVSPQAVVSTSADFPDSQRIPEAFREELLAREIPLLELSETGVVTIEAGPREASLCPHSEEAEALELTRSHHILPVPLR